VRLKKKVITSEHGLIQNFVRWFHNKYGKYELVPNGDDAFIGKLMSSSSDRLVVTTDVLVENTHFRLSWENKVERLGLRYWESLGYKLAAVNLSDLASMGNVLPRYAVLNFGFPDGFVQEYAKRICNGISQCAGPRGMSVVGGDTVKSEMLWLGMTAIGVRRGTEKTNVLTREGVTPGDYIFCTGTLGDAKAGLEILEHRKLYRDNGKDSRRLAWRLCRPVPRMEEGKALAATGCVSSMMDISDGLIQSLGLLSRSNDVGFEVNLNALPVSPELNTWCHRNKRDVYAYAVPGGEEYELLFSVNEKCVGKFSNKCPVYKPFARAVKRKGIRFVMDNGIAEEKRFYGYEAFNKKK